MSFHRGFHAYDWVRGQEHDPYDSGPPRRRLGTASRGAVRSGHRRAQG
jgi:hypothetical protein